jgi:hypothetical protein
MTNPTPEQVAALVERLKTQDLFTGYSNDADDFRKAVQTLLALSARLKEAEEVIGFLATHFSVEDGPNAKVSQYGELELWWSARDSHADPSALDNPKMCMGVAGNSFSLVAMGELRAVIRRAAAFLEPGGMDERR